MSNQEALEILTEMQKWRRGEYEYGNDGEYHTMPYKPKVYGEALDVAIEALKHNA